MTTDGFALPEIRRSTLGRPRLLIGDSERTEVCALLNRHFTDGRLTLDELQERLDSCVRARTLQNLQALCEDLPRLGPPTATPAPRPAPNSLMRTAWQALVGMGVLLTVPIVLLMLLGSTLLGAGVLFFSLIGGSLATFIGAGTTYLLVAKPKGPTR